MPVNLNSLLRYKTIDECLSNPNAKCTIEYLIEKCSEKLNDTQGIGSVSERTIRNDIRILRSDALGFNAPIVVKDGIYSYDYDDYSIFEKPVCELELLKDLQTLLVEEFDNIQNKKLPYLLVELAKITGEKNPTRCLPDDNLILEKRTTTFSISEINIYKRELEAFIYELYKMNQPDAEFTPSFIQNRKQIYLNWEFIFGAL